jgi:hypothetical protein
MVREGKEMQPADKPSHAKILNKPAHTRKYQGTGQDQTPATTSDQESPLHCHPAGGDG